MGDRALLILQAFSHFTYVTAHSPTFPSLYLRHSSFSNLSVASPTSQLILRPFFRFSYVTGFSLTSPGEPPMFNIHCLSYELNSNCIFGYSTDCFIFKYPANKFRNLAVLTQSNGKRFWEPLARRRIKFSRIYLHR